nr:hypothetical protein [Escherichia coli]
MKQDTVVIQSMKYTVKLFVGELINADGFISIDDDLKADFQNLKQKAKSICSCLSTKRTY